MRSTRLRQAATVVVTGLTAALLPLFGPLAPAQAAGCQDETHNDTNPLLVVGCDDTTPPQTSLGSITPTPGSAGYIRSSSVSITFTGTHNDSSDTGPIGFECQLYNTAAAPSTWTACTSPFAQSDLDESSATPYTFRVRAIDSNDAAIHACDASGDVLDPLCAQDPDVADSDPTPVTVTLKVDTVEPNTFLTRTPTDDLRPDWPVTDTTSPQVTLNASEPGTFKCALNGKSYPCHGGVNTLSNLPGGAKTFVARAVDRAGNIDPSASTATFWVPLNIKKAGKSWKKVTAAGYFGKDYLTADKVGATLKIKGQRGVEEVRLLAPSGPKYGVLEVKVGNGQWYTVDLHSKRTVRQKMYLVRDEYTTSQSGSIQIRVKSLPRGGSVRVDAYVARK